jgi:hypothetical protein
LGGVWWRRVGSGLWGMLCGEEGGADGEVWAVGGNVEWDGLGYGAVSWVDIELGKGKGSGKAHGSRWWDSEAFVEEVMRSTEWLQLDDDGLGEHVEAAGTYKPVALPEIQGTKTSGMEWMVGAWPGRNCSIRAAMEKARWNEERERGLVGRRPAGRCGM